MGRGVVEHEYMVRAGGAGAVRRQQIRAPPRLGNTRGAFRRAWGWSAGCVRACDGWARASKTKWSTGLTWQANMTNRGW